ncbi:DUF3375 domain-containing protein [Actinoplanes oblitus]|uniref:DUF3375 domain-containing protein n=1 Tax=Actinoplanes oblitus TaxID=3040509 RepID=A0ABY8WMI0_9ACTN|nr:DUF3375 domain-containing protein [Actinoplanes oblitus]WIM98642.1 DUF3375 domain-containing protein [Actinoplanes oblitus]
MEIDEIDTLRRNSAAWRLLRADNAALILYFLGKAFTEQNLRSIAAPDLASQLDGELAAINERAGEVLYPRPAKAYLEDWARPDAGWLRKFYPPGSDEPHFDATPAVEKALTWVRSLPSRSFVGTESRLNIVFDLLRQLAFGTETDPEARLEELYRRRAEIDAEISRVLAGDIPIMDSAAQRDRYQQLTITARGLLADFREVEANFRALDRDLREKVALWQGSKGALLDDVLGSRSAITDSDQGRSFHAFYDFLLSAQRQSELAELLQRVHQLETIDDPDPRLRRIHHHWLDAGERTQATVRLLSEQLRKFLDDQVWLENRRVMDVLHSIEARALALRDLPADTFVMEIDAAAPVINLPMERPLYRPGNRAVLDSSVPEGPDDEQVDVSALFEQVYVDPGRLRAAVVRALRHETHVELPDVIAEQPLEQGLAELVTYLTLTDPSFDTVFDEGHQQHITWLDNDGRSRRVHLPRVIFTRAAAGQVNVA